MLYGVKKRALCRGAANWRQLLDNNLPPLLMHVCWCSQPFRLVHLKYRKQAFLGEVGVSSRYLLLLSVVKQSAMPVLKEHKNPKLLAGLSAELNRYSMVLDVIIVIYSAQFVCNSRPRNLLHSAKFNLDPFYFSVPFFLRVSIHIYTNPVDSAVLSGKPIYKSNAFPSCK